MSLYLSQPKENNRNQKHILLIGLPRSGTTWEFNTLSCDSNIVGVFEPDNELINPIAFHRKKQNHRFQQIDTTYRINSQKIFWEQVFRGGWKKNAFYHLIKKIYLRNQKKIEYLIERRCGVVIPNNRLIRFIPVDKQYFRHDNILFSELLNLLTKRTLKSRLLIKSVFAVNQLYFLKSRYDPQIVVIVRKIRNLVASYLRLKMPDAYRYNFEIPKEISFRIRNIDDEIFLKIVIQACKLTNQLLRYHKTDKESILIIHENACLNPVEHFDSLFQKLNLKFGPAIERYLEKVNRDGKGFTAIRNVKKEQNRFLDILSNYYLDLIKIVTEYYNLSEYY